MTRRPPRTTGTRFGSRLAVVLVGAAAVVGLTAGCTAGAGPTPTRSAPAPRPAVSTSSPSPTAPAAPTLAPGGTAADNLPVFAATVDSVWASSDSLSGRAYIDALAAAGFEKSAMQVTEDMTTVGNPAESIQFSVRWGDQCLVGQVGPATGDPVAVVLPGLAEGGCLVGRTRAIDW